MRSATSTPIQRTTHSQSRPVWFIPLLLGLLIALALWLSWSPSSIQAQRPALPGNAQSLPQALVPLDGIAQVAAGGAHTCALSTAGGVKCWGYNGYGQLGDGTTAEKSTPVDVLGLGSGVAAIAAGGKHTCALSTAGGVKCWGYNVFGQLGDGTTTGPFEGKPTPVDVLGLGSGVAAIAAGYGHTCALTTAGGVKCWGNNDTGQLGDGSTVQRLTPVEVVGLGSGVAAIVGGGSHTCALTTAGGVKCWGMDLDGQLGDGGTNWKKSTPVDVVGLVSGVAAITTGGRHTCALTSTGGVKCWGYNGYGQLGDDTATNKSTPVDVVGLGSGVAAITGGGGHTCALTITSGSKCWGDNGYGQVGDGTTARKSSPVDVLGLGSGMVAIAAGDNHTCALSTASGVKCWGWNDTTNRSTPADVVGLGSGMATIAAGGWYTCALNTAGGVKCWGWNDSGQLGDGSYTNKSAPVDVVGLGSGAAVLATGWAHTCALSTTGGVKCWGSNEYGQLGDGTSGDGASKPTPVDVVGLGSGMAAIAVGLWHTCALSTAGGVKCWGYNELGQLGDGSTGDKTTPRSVVGLGSGVAAITAGYLHTCALTAAGAVKCWGYNRSGQLGDGTSGDGASKPTPVDVVGLDSGVVAITAGSRHTCALSTAGGVKCWGQNSFSQLGDGSTTDYTTPVDVVGLGSGVVAIAAGGAHTCVLSTAGGVKCWGWGWDGQLGDGSSGSGGIKSTPVDVVGLGSGVAAITAGDLHTCALSTTGGVKCWGSNRYGQLGNGTAWRTTPVDVLVQPPLSNHLFLPAVQR